MKALMTTLLFLTSTASAQNWSVTLYINENYGGAAFTATGNVAQITGPVFKEASSARITNADHAWTVLWESENFNAHDDQLWIEGSRDMSSFAVPGRPHGNNSWNDLIKAISFSASPPSWDGNDNRSICVFNGPCLTQAQRMIQENPVIVDPQPEHNGWFIKVCPAQSNAGLTGISLFLGNHNDNGSHFMWRTWYRVNPTTSMPDPPIFSLPMNFLYIRDIYVGAQAIPNETYASLCVGYHNGITRAMHFTKYEDYQPDENDHDDGCEC